MKPENVECPICGGPMTSRANRATGQRFWGCNTYPTCRGTRNTDGDAPGEDAARRATAESDVMPSDRQRGNDRGRWRNG